MLAVPPERRSAARRKFFTDLRDTVTPNAMVDLLVAISRNQVVSRHGAALLFDAMKRSVTGPERIKRLLPSNTVLAHKTGFLSIGVINDAVGCSHWARAVSPFLVGCFTFEGRIAAD